MLMDSERERMQRLMKDKDCPLCGKQEWAFSDMRKVFLIDGDEAKSIGNSQVADRLKTGDGDIRGRKRVELSCRSCGNTILIDFSRGR